MTYVMVLNVAEQIDLKSMQSWMGILNNIFHQAQVIFDVDDKYQMTLYFK